MTIVDAIKIAIKKAGRPLTVKEIYHTVVNNELYVFGAKNPIGVVAGQIRRHCIGIDFPTANPVKHFKLVGKNLYDLKSSGHVNDEITKTRTDQSDQLPEEIIYTQYQHHLANLQQSLVETIIKSDPAFFEQLVVDLLLKMGYGENGLGKRKGKSGDGGIDGEILQDRLGLDRIYIQAKRYSDNPIGRPAVQQFVGALENITKGVFITTSTFTNEAKDYAAKQQQKSLVLIDGVKLANLMIDYGVGVQEMTAYKTYKIDQNYFSENDI